MEGGKEQGLRRGERVLAFDVLNILACIGVIALHHNGLVHSFDGSRAWAESLVVECLFYWCVPVFMMISGANLMRYRDRYDTATFFKKRFVNTVIPWLFWSVVVLTAKVWRGTITLGAHPLLRAVDMIFSFTQVEYVYWFFGALFACYLAIPVLSLLCEERKALWYIVLLNFVFSSCLPPLRSWLGFSFSLDVPLVASMIEFVLLGYLLATKPPEKKQRLALYAAGIVCVIFRYVYTFHYSFLRGETDTTIKGYMMFHSVFWAAAVFVLGMQIPWEKIFSEKFRALLPKISACSFGVYLIHRIVMPVEAQLFSLDDHSLLWRTACIFLTYGISLGITMVLKKIPGVKYTVGS